MQVGMIGLGKMGANMVSRLLLGKHEVVAFDFSADAVKAAAAGGAVAASSLKDMVSKLKPPRHVWVMVPAGKPTEDTVTELMGLLQSGDTIIEGGNSNFREAQKDYARCKPLGINFIDAGTSGGVWGLKNGYALMVGGDKEAVKRAEPIFLTLAPDDGGYGHVGAVGAGHFVKMVHNGIEYGMMAAYGEGFEIMEKSEFNLDLHQISKLWETGSVVRSWLLELCTLAFAEDAKLASIKGFVEDTGEGRWTVEEAIAESVPAPIITLSLMMRFASRQPESFSAKVVAALRNQFGGHAVQHENGAAGKPVAH